MGRRTTKSKTKKTEIAMSLASLVQVGPEKKRAVVYFNVTDLVADERLDAFEKDPKSILKWLEKFELVMIEDDAEKDITGSVD